MAQTGAIIRATVYKEYRGGQSSPLRFDQFDGLVEAMLVYPISIRNRTITRKHPCARCARLCSPRMLLGLDPAHGHRFQLRNHLALPSPWRCARDLRSVDEGETWGKSRIIPRQIIACRSQAVNSLVAQIPSRSYVPINSSAFSTSARSPRKTGTRWCSSVGCTSRMLPLPVDAYPPAC
jgi:hypothetical protein